MSHTIYSVVLVIALGSVGCGSDDKQRNKTATVIESPSPVERPKANPAPPPVAPAPLVPSAPAVSAIPAGRNPKSPGTHKARGLIAATTVQGAVEESRASKLATEILNLPLADRLRWTEQEFAKRGIK
jgi:hypothetical protein